MFSSCEETKQKCVPTKSRELKKTLSFLLYQNQSPSREFCFILTECMKIMPSSFFQNFVIVP